MGKSWRPRSSSLAGYMYCQTRAAFDRALAVGDMVQSPATGERDTKYADLGTCIHLMTQRALGCVFDHEPEPLDPSVELSAAKLFDGDLARTQIAIATATAAACKAMPQAPDGKPWRAEVAVKTRLLTGHIDFLSQCGTVIVDLKTTSRKPDHNRVKGEHFLQMLAYKLLVPSVQRAHILYVDSLGARWTLLTPPIDFTTDTAKEAVARLPQFLKRIRSPKIYHTAIPAPGGHCSGCFCPHTAICKDALIPPPGVVVDNQPATSMPTVSEIFP